MFRVAMLDSEQMRSSGGRKSLRCRDSSLTRYLPLSHVTNYVCYHAAHVKTVWFPMLASAGTALSVPINRRRSDTTAVAFQKW